MSVELRPISVGDLKLYNVTLHGKKDNPFGKTDKFSIEGSGKLLILAENTEDCNRLAREYLSQEWPSADANSLQYNFVAAQVLVEVEDSGEKK